MNRSVYVAETGKINGRYLARVLRDGVLIWQSKRSYLDQLKALNAAKKFVARAECK